jgi:ankyrin repeat protein
MDSGIDVGAAGDDGHTALHIAAMHGRRAVVELLVARGGDMDQENHSGLTPRHLLNLFAEISQQNLPAESL